MAHWHIVGVGAIGCLWAHKLSNAGHEVSLILKDSHQLGRYEAANGIHLQALNDKTTTRYFSAYLAGDFHQPIEHLLVCCKSWQSVEILTGLQHLLTSNSSVVLLQNGFGQLHQSKPLLEHCAYYCVSTTDGAFKTDDFSVTLAGNGNTVIGPFNAAAQQRKIELANAQWQDNIETILWRKLCVNAVINPLTALYNIKNGGILTTTACAQMINPLCNEISNIARTAEQALTPADIQQAVHDVAQKTAANSSSMREDVLAGRRTEILEINGYLSALAKTQGTTAPLNDKLILAISQISPTRQPPQPTT